MKRVLCLCIALSLALCVGVYPISAAEDALLDVSGVNTYRGENALVLYDTSGARTNTNEWGFEVCVGSDGVISSVGGNNSIVPDGGFVLSGHGTSAALLSASCSVGRYAKFYPQTRKVRISDTIPSAEFNFEVEVTGHNETRWEDMLVVYDRSGSYTGTNAWGYEVTVTNGIVTQIGGNNSYIPQNGFVVSAHGDAVGKIESVTLGMNAVYIESDSKIRFTYGINSIIRGDGIRINDIQARIDSAKAGFEAVDYISAQASLDAAKTSYQTASDNFIANGNSAVYELASAQINAALDDIGALCCESYPAEYRGAWVGYPAGNTRELIAEHVQSLYEGGINMIALQTQYSSCMIYPTPEGSLFEQNPTFGGVDVLQIYIEECHKRGMEFHCWVPVYFVGSVNSPNKDIGVLAKKPEWRLKNNEGGYTDSSGYMFLDPCNSEVQDFLLETYRYLITEYDIDGFQLDYIRFPSRGDLDFGYGSATTAAFADIYGVTPQYSTSAAYWSDWCAFRAEFVTDFVRKMRALVDEYAPDVLLTADVFPEIKSSSTGIYQDYGTWMQEGLLDQIYPMTYGRDSVSAYLPPILEQANGTPVVAGLGLFEDAVSVSDAERQIIEARALGCIGTCTFADAAFIKKRAGERLTETVWADSPVSPAGDSALMASACFEYMASRLSKSIIPQSALGEASAKQLYSLLMSQALRLAAEGNESLTDALTKISFRLNTLPPGNSAVKVLKADIAHLRFMLASAKTGEKTYCTLSDDGKYIYTIPGTSALRLTERLFRLPAVSVNGTGSTGSVVSYGESGKTLTVVCIGDVDGDRECGSTDISLAIAARLETITLSAPQLIACGGDGLSVAPSDISLLIAYRLGTVARPNS